MTLATKSCTPCEGGVPKLTEGEARSYLTQVEGWELRGDKIHKDIKFPTFMDGIRFVDRLAEVAEGQGHHPDIFIYYRVVRLDIWTHAIGGLSENDFILAAKADALLR